MTNVKEATCQFNFTATDGLSANKLCHSKVTVTIIVKLRSMITYENQQFIGFVATERCERRFELITRKVMNILRKSTTTDIIVFMCQRILTTNMKGNVRNFVRRVNMLISELH